MSIFNQFPWTNYREYNLDWVIRTVKKCLEDVGSTTDAIADLESRMTAAEGNITNLQGRMSTVEGYGSRITALEAQHPNTVIIRGTPGDYSYRSGDSYDKADAILLGYINQNPGLDDLGHIVYQQSAISPYYWPMTSFELLSSPIGSYQITFADNTVVTINRDGTIS